MLQFYIAVHSCRLLYKLMVTVVYNPHLSHHNTFIHREGMEMIEGQIRRIKIGEKKKVRELKGGRN